MYAFYLKILIDESHNQFSSSQITTSDYYITSDGKPRYWRRPYAFLCIFAFVRCLFSQETDKSSTGMKGHVSEYELSPHLICSISPSNMDDCNDSKWVLPATHYRGVPQCTIFFSQCTILFALVFLWLILDVCSVSKCLLHYLSSCSNTT